MIVILDNGHGYQTPGKRSPIWSDGRQLVEYEFNRDIVSRIHEALKSLGIESIILVSEQDDIPLQERVRRANLIASKNKGAFLVSVHANAGGGTGWEIFTTPGETASDKIASLMVYEAERFLRAEGFRVRSDYADGDGDKEERFKILKDTSCPAVLTENLFMDNERDCKFLLSQYGRGIITEIHIEAIRKIAGR
jgi:N-acetylmuramoyl-L-alanine amidase